MIKRTCMWGWLCLTLFESVRLAGDFSVSIVNHACHVSKSATTAMCFDPLCCFLKVGRLCSALGWDGGRHCVRSGDKGRTLAKMNTRID